MQWTAGFNLYRRADALDPPPLTRIVRHHRNMAEPKSVGMIFYNSRARWVAVINLATATAGIYLSMRFVDGGLRWLMVVFLSLFSLFWVKDVFFGFPLKLISDGTKLHWQDGKQTGSAP